MFSSLAMLHIHPHLATREAKAAVKPIEQCDKIQWDVFHFLSICFKWFCHVIVNSSDLKIN